MTSKLTEAIRVLRSEAAGDENSNWETFCGVLASALEELSGKGDVGGEVGEPVSVDELLRVSNERHMLRIERDDLKRRAEAAEARTARDKVHIEALQLGLTEATEAFEKQRATLRGDLEAARARVGELEAEGTAVQLVVNALSSGGHPVVSAASIAGGGVALTSRKGDRSARIEVEGREIVLTTQAGDEPPNYRELDAATAAREALRFLHSTPSAPTPAVVEKRFVSGAHAYKHYGVETEEKESPPRDSGGETTGAVGSADAATREGAVATPSGEAAGTSAQPPVPGGPSAPGLTPEDAEDGHLLPAHRELERIWDEADDPDDFHPHRTAKEALWLAGYERGHYEGAKAAKAKGGA